MVLCLSSFTAMHVTCSSGIVCEFACEFVIKRQSPGVVITRQFWQCDDGFVLCPSCSVCTNQGMVHVLLHVLLSPFGWACSSDQLSLASLVVPSSLHQHLHLLFPRSSHRLLLSCCVPSVLQNATGLTCSLTALNLVSVPASRKPDQFRSKQTHTSIIYTPLFTSSLIVVPPREFRMCRFFSSSTATFPP